jgi:hypothetical protein
MLQFADGTPCAGPAHASCIDCVLGANGRPPVPSFASRFTAALRAALGGAPALGPEENRDRFRALHDALGQYHRVCTPSRFVIDELARQGMAIDDALPIARRRGRRLSGADRGGRCPSGRSVRCASASSGGTSATGAARSSKPCARSELPLIDFTAGAADRAYDAVLAPLLAAEPRDLPRPLPGRRAPPFGALTCCRPFDLPESFDAARGAPRGSTVLGTDRRVARVGVDGEDGLLVPAMIPLRWRGVRARRSRPARRLRGRAGGRGRVKSMAYAAEVEQGSRPRLSSARRLERSGSKSSHPATSRGARGSILEGPQHRSEQRIGLRRRAADGRTRAPRSIRRRRDDRSTHGQAQSEKPDRETDGTPETARPRRGRGGRGGPARRPAARRRLPVRQVRGEAVARIETGRDERRTEPAAEYARRIREPAHVAPSQRTVPARTKVVRRPRASARRRRGGLPRSGSSPRRGSIPADARFLESSAGSERSRPQQRGDRVEVVAGDRGGESAPPRAPRDRRGDAPPRVRRRWRSTPSEPRRRAPVCASSSRAEAGWQQGCRKPLIRSRSRNDWNLGAASDPCQPPPRAGRWSARRSMEWVRLPSSADPKVARQQATTPPASTAGDRRRSALGGFSGSSRRCHPGSSSRRGCGCAVVAPDLRPRTSLFPSSRRSTSPTATSAGVSPNLD